MDRESNPSPRQHAIHHMHHRFPFTVALAIILSGCQNREVIGGVIKLDFDHTKAIPVKDAILTKVDDETPVPSDETWGQADGTPLTYSYKLCFGNGKYIIPDYLLTGISDIDIGSIEYYDVGGVTHLSFQGGDAGGSYNC